MHTGAVTLTQRRHNDAPYNNMSFYDGGAVGFIFDLLREKRNGRAPVFTQHKRVTMFTNIDFMKLQSKLRDNEQYVVDISVCSNVFSARITEQVINAEGKLTHNIDESKTLSALSSDELAAWINS